MKRGWRDLQCSLLILLLPSTKDETGPTAVITLDQQSFGHLSAEPPIAVQCSMQLEEGVLADVLSRLDMDQPAPARGVSQA